MILLNGSVFRSPIEEDNRVLKFPLISELSGQEIVCVSGTNRHCLAVNKEGRVFSRGSNGDRQLSLGTGTKSVSSFTKIWSLEGYKIRAAFAGCSHSLFETYEGKILSCGANSYGQLLLSSSLGEEICSPMQTTIKNRDPFFIAGDGISIVFIGRYPPPNSPNMRILEYK